MADRARAARVGTAAEELRKATEKHMMAVEAQRSRLVVLVAEAFAIQREFKTFLGKPRRGDKALRPVYEAETSKVHQRMAWACEALHEGTVATASPLCDRPTGPRSLGEAANPVPVVAGIIGDMKYSESETAAYLKSTILRDFSAPLSTEPRKDKGTYYSRRVGCYEAPVPVLLRYPFDLLGIQHTGPGEKFAWAVEFNYKGFPAYLGYHKFGVKAGIICSLSRAESENHLNMMLDRIFSAAHVVEKLLSERAPEAIRQGNVTVANQYRRLRAPYEYHRDRAINPVFVADEREHRRFNGGQSWTHISGKMVMKMHASHDLVASTVAFLSLLEHLFVLSLPFAGYNPESEDLTAFIGDRWGVKWERIIGDKNPEARDLRRRMSEVVEQWRNPYSHGGFEKGHGSSLYVHTPGLGALPMGLTRVRESTFFSFNPAPKGDIESIYSLFDEIESYLKSILPGAYTWIESGLDVRFDSEFAQELAEASQIDGGVEKLVDQYICRQEMIDNMDYY